MSPEATDSSRRARENGRTLIAAARRVVVLTGAGISAESGVPTFRGADGLWRRHRPEELATPAAFARDSRLVWDWYGWRRERVLACRPNAAHHALARFALRRDGVTIITQNVDGLHIDAARMEAGDGDAGAALPLELHGSLFRIRCTGCGQRREHRERIDASSVDSLPRCAGCGELARPDVVWFGEMLDEALLDRAFRAASEADVCLVIGTSALVHPAASVPVVAREHGAALVEVNPEPTPLTTSVTVSLRAGAVDAVPELLGTSGPDRAERPE